MKLMLGQPWSQIVSRLTNEKAKQELFLLPGLAVCSSLVTSVFWVANRIIVKRFKTKQTLQNRFITIVSNTNLTII